MGIVSFKKTFSEQQIKDLVQYIHTNLDLVKEEHGIEVQDKKRIPTEKLNLRLDTIITGFEVPWNGIPAEWRYVG